MNEIIIDLIRHGEPIGGKKYRGQTDDALSEVGWQQMAEMQMLFGEQSWQKVVSSDLKRCFNFASQVAENKQIPLLCEADFREINFGIWEGKTAQQIEQEFPHQLLAYYQNPAKHTPQNAESITEFNKRVLEAWCSVSPRYGIEV